MSMHNPAHPGEILKTLVIEPLGLSVMETAQRLGVSRKSLSRVVNCRGGVTPEMALRLEMTFGNRTQRTGSGFKTPMISGKRDNARPHCQLDH